MQLTIKIENREIKLLLRQKKRVLDEKSFVEECNLMEKLLLEIDALLKKNKLEPKDIENIRVNSNLSESYTTTRIAKSVANAWTLGEK